MTFEIELISPVAIEQGLKFTVREGGHTVGAGTVTEIEGVIHILVVNRTPIGVLFLY
ncbi:MAG: hypothetical protein ACLUPK_09295 [Veillonella sp.]